MGAGAATWAAVQVCREMEPGQRVVVILPDSIRNYLSKFVDDAWMRRHGFSEADWEMGTIGDIVRRLNRDMGLTVLLVEQNARAALKLADRGYVIETGRIILDGTASELQEAPEVQRAYLGKGYREVWE